MNGAVFSSDARLEHACVMLRRGGHHVTEARSAREADAVLERGPAGFDFVVLPIRAAENGVTELSGQPIAVDAFLKGLRPGVPVFTGRRTEYLKGLSLRLYNFFEDEELARKNAALTAEGVLYLLLSRTSRSIFDYTYDLLGAGKTGACIYALLTRLGLKVRLVTRRGGDGSVPYDSWRAAPPAPVVINTVPGPVVTGDMLADWTRKVFLLDLSSGELGADPAAKAAANLTYLAAPPLPGLVAPESAGALLADYVEAVLAGKKG